MQDDRNIVIYDSNDSPTYTPQAPMQFPKVVALEGSDIATNNPSAAVEML